MDTGDQGPSAVDRDPWALSDVGPAALHRHALGLANAFRSALGLAPGNSAIVSLPSAADAADRLAAAGVAASVRAGRLRLAFHLYNEQADVDMRRTC